MTFTPSKGFLEEQLDIVRKSLSSPEGRAELIGALDQDTADTLRRMSPKQFNRESPEIIAKFITKQYRAAVEAELMNPNPKTGSGDTGNAGDPTTSQPEVK